MSKRVKVWFDKPDVSEQLLKSPEMQAVIQEQAEAIAGRAGDGYEVVVKTGKRRCHANIVTASNDARRDNAENNTLLRAMNHG